MKPPTRLALTLVVANLLSLPLFAGPASTSADYKQSKEVAPQPPPPPPSCNWAGFYLGVNAGGQFGHSEDKDLDNYNFPDRPWGYSESGFVGGGQIGFNWQWHCLVLGPEIDVGYMNLNGHGVETGFPQDTFGKSDSDFYTTFRGRIGFAIDCWLVYATGGGIGVNYHAKVTDNTFDVAGPDTFNASGDDLIWGYTVGGGVERMLGRHWSVKVEYLYFNLDDQNFSAVSDNGFGPYRWSADTHGHIVRAGLNFHF